MDRRGFDPMATAEATWSLSRRGIARLLIGAALGGSVELSVHKVAAIRRGAAAWRSATATTPRPGAPVRLDLVLEPRSAPGQALDVATLVGIRTVLQRRLELRGLAGGVARRPDGRIVVRVDATDDPERVTRALVATTLLEIIDPRGRYLPPGAEVRTTLDMPADDVAASPAATQGADGTSPVYTTIVSGADFSDFYAAAVNGAPVVGFALQPQGARRLFDFTQSHVGGPLAIVLDKRVISSPRISGAIASHGIITGIPPEQVHDLVAQLNAGVLPVPLVVVERHLAPAGEAATPLPTLAAR